MSEKAKTVPGYTPCHLSHLDWQQGKFLAVKNSELILPGSAPDKLFWSFKQRQKLKPLIHAEHYIGHYQEKACWACDIREDEHASEQSEARSIRSLLGQYPDDLFQLAGTGTQLVRWYQDHRFCGRCGALTEVLDNETATCCNVCELHFYPRLSPCAIVLVTRGDHCLLAKNANCQTDYYSCLAGYVEPGETLEQTVHREVYEEVGVNVTRLRYFGSQPWPFPGQLMLGFHVDYDGGDIRPDGVEIVDAGWFRYDNLPPRPTPESLSGKLIQDFVLSRRKR